MYQVNVGNKIIYYPANSECTIFGTELTEDVGQAGEFRFKVPPTNPYYSEFPHHELTPPVLLMQFLIPP